MRIVTLGDLLLDVVVRLDTSLVTGDDQPAHTSTGPGGQAANVAAWARELGAEARFVGKRGADAAGELVTRELEERGVTVAGPRGGRTGVVVSAIQGRDYARIYVKELDKGRATVALSPEEQEEVDEIVRESGSRITRKRLLGTAGVAAGGALGFALVTPALSLGPALETSS